MLTVATSSGEIITVRLAELLSQAAISRSLKQLHLSSSPLTALAAACLLGSLPALQAGLALCWQHKRA
jgi:hypothetical protein